MKPLPHRRPLALATLLLGLALPACGDDHDHHAEPDAGAQPDAGEQPSPDAAPEEPLTSTRGRLAVASSDAASPDLWIIDLDDGSVVLRDTLITPASVYAASPTSRYLYVNQRLANIVDIFQAGISLVDDATERRVAKATPGLLPTFFDGLLPPPRVSHGGWTVVFNDGDGTFDYLHEPSLETPRLFLRRASTDGGHHGVAVASHNFLLASSSRPDPLPSNPDRRRAWGATVRSLSAPATVVASNDDCEGLHGEASNNEVVAFGCADGVLLADWHQGAFVFRKLPNPADLAQPGRVSTVRAHDALDRLIGNWGTTGFVIIDYTAEPVAWTFVDVGALRRNFLLSDDGASLVVLAGDGKLYRFDARTGATLDPGLDVTPGFESSAGAPQLVVGGGHGYVIDPRDGKVTEVDLGEWTTERIFQLGGAPASGAVFGAVP